MSRDFVKPFPPVIMSVTQPLTAVLIEQVKDSPAKDPTPHECQMIHALVQPFGYRGITQHMVQDLFSEADPLTRMFMTFERLAQRGWRLSISDTITRVNTDENRYFARAFNTVQKSGDWMTTELLGASAAAPTPAGAIFRLMIKIMEQALRRRDLQ